VKKPIPAPTPEVVLPPNISHDYFEDFESHPFRYSAIEFEWVNAWWLAEAALLSYADSAFVTDRFSKTGLELAGQQPFSGGSTQCYIAHNDAFVIVVFRGTQVPKPGADQNPLQALKDSLSDLYADAKLELADTGQGYYVHRGFLDALEEVWTDVSKYLDKLRAEKPDRKFWFTGHSLGAGLATLAANRCGYLNGLYTFGSPRVGCRKFARQFRVRTYRFVNNNDIVARVPHFGPFRPPRLLPGAYRHVGQLYYMDRNHDIAALADKRNRTPQVTGQSIPGVFTAFRDSGRNALMQAPGEFLIDHAPLYYALHIWNYYALGLPHT